VASIPRSSSHPPASPPSVGGWPRPVGKDPLDRLQRLLVAVVSAIGRALDDGAGQLCHEPVLHSQKIEAATPSLRRRTTTRQRLARCAGAEGVGGLRASARTGRDRPDVLERGLRIHLAHLRCVPGIDRSDHTKL
jgi:hypothetical protein